MSVIKGYIKSATNLNFGKSFTNERDAEYYFQSYVCDIFNEACKKAGFLFSNNPSTLLDMDNDYAEFELLISGLSLQSDEAERQTDIIFKYFRNNIKKIVKNEWIGYNIVRGYFDDCNGLCICLGSERQIKAYKKSGSLQHIEPLK